MKVEFINKNKLKITLTYEDLETRKISLADLEKNANVTLNLIEELDLDEDFGITYSQLLIETSSDNNNLYIYHYYYKNRRSSRIKKIFSFRSFF